MRQRLVGTVGCPGCGWVSGSTDLWVRYGFTFGVFEHPEAGRVLVADGLRLPGCPACAGVLELDVLGPWAVPLDDVAGELGLSQTEIDEAE